MDAEGKIEKVGNNLQQSLEYLLVIIMPIMVMCFCGGGPNRRSAIWKRQF